MKKALKNPSIEMKNLKIDKKTHDRVKQHCLENNYWIHLFVEEVINDFLDKTESKL